MKHLKLLHYFCIACCLVLLLTNCNPEDENPAPGIPVVNITGDGLEDDTFVGSPGETLNVVIEIQAPLGFNTLIIRKFVNDTEETGFVENISRGTGVTPPSTFTHEFEYILRDDEIGSEIYFTFEAVDENNTSGVSTLYIETVAAPAARYTSVLLFAPLENRDSETFFSTNTGETYSMNDVLNSSEPISGNIDFGYFYGDQLGASLAAPITYPLPDYGVANWVVRNSTTIGRTSITPGQYVEITEDNLQAINDAFESANIGANPNLVSNLLIGEILAFETDNTKTGGSKRGLIQVQSIEGTTGSTARIQIEVLVMQ